MRAPTQPIGRTWWVRVPGFVVGAAALNRADWLWRDAPTSIADADWLPEFAIAFAAVGAVNLIWHATAPWRTTSGAPWVALATFTVWMAYALTILADLGLTAVRATAIDLMALAVMIAWTWGPDRDRIDA